MVGFRKIVACAVAAGMAGVFAGAPLGASADAPPSYAAPAPANSLETIKGTIEDFDGKYHLHLNDVRGFVDDVTLHDGTVINPLGLTLEPGMRVSIEGRAEGRTFAADVVDTPEYGYAPSAGWAEPAPWYPPYYYGYGPGWGWWGAPYYGVSLGLAFGFGGYWGGCCWGGWGGWGWSHGPYFGNRPFPPRGVPGRPGIPGRPGFPGRPGVRAPAAPAHAFSGFHGVRLR